MDQMDNLVKSNQELREVNVSLEMEIESLTKSLQKMDQTDDLVKSNQELREENASLKLEIESLTKSSQMRGPSSGPTIPTEFIAVVDDIFSHTSLLTKTEKEELEKQSSFKSYTTSTYHHFLVSENQSQEAPLRFIYFELSPYCKGWKSTHFNGGRGVYKLPATGRYRFSIEGEFEHGSGSTEWFLCCGEGDEPHQFPVGYEQFSEYNSFTAEKRMSLFTLKVEKGYCSNEKIVCLKAKKGAHVWVECHQSIKKAFNNYDDSLSCVISGTFLD